jgi:hypothetical protein
MSLTIVVVLEKCPFFSRVLNSYSYFLDLFGLFWINLVKNSQVSSSKAILHGYSY